MNTINNTDNSALLSSNTSSTSAVQSQTETESAQTSSTDANETSKDSVQVSDRAAKIQKLNAEFFPGGPSTVSITPEFIKRLEEYGLIDGAAAQRLGAASEKSSEQDALNQVSTAIDLIKTRAQKNDAPSSVIEALSQAKDVIDNFGISTSANKHDIKQILSELAQYKQSEQGQWLSDDDKKIIEQIELALNVADQMNPQNRTAQQLDKYVSVYNQAQS